MPFLDSSSYRAPLGFGNGHVQTVYPALFRRVEPVTIHRERIELADGDFLDLDWSSTPGESSGKRLAILSHGLEASSGQSYVQGMAAALVRRGWDVLAWNFRGCSGEPNRLLRSYHSGSSDDLRTVLDHCLSRCRHEQIALVGFSLGGNVTLKLLGEWGDAVDSRVTGAVAFSVPCDLASSAEKMAGFSQGIYMRRFLKDLRKKIRQKQAAFPESVDLEGLDRIKTFREFDGRYTASMNGFADAEDYWERCSSRNVLKGIRIPALLVNASDDPFRGPACFPRAEAEASDHFYFERPRNGGHIGFVPRDRSGEYWSEIRAAAFLDGEGL